MFIKNWVGMRTIKTGLAVIISTYLSKTFLVTNPFYAVIGTIFAMQNTVKNSFTMGKNRILGTMLGAFIGFSFATTNITHPLYIGLAIMFAIICCNALKLNASILITLTVCLSIIIGAEDRELLSYTFLRTTDTSIGIIVSLLINYFIHQPNYLGHLTEEIEKIEYMTIEFVKSILVHKDLSLEKLNGELSRLDAIYKNYSADRKYNKNPVNSQKLKKAIEACHDIYFHAKCMVKIEEEADLTELNPENRLKILEFFSNDSPKEIQLVEPIHPIFEYHIHQMLNQLQILTKTIEDLAEHLENESPPPA